jgi:hypothetical protein
VKEKLKLRRVRTVTHSYITDTIHLDPDEFKSLGAPLSSEAFAAWISDHCDSLKTNPDLSEFTRLKLSKLDYYNEDREQRVDESCVECL